MVGYLPGVILRANNGVLIRAPNGVLIRAPDGANKQRLCNQVTSSAIGFRVRSSQGEAAIVEENILASDGVIHVIDAVV